MRQIGAGAVAAGGFITLLKTIPTIASSFKESISSFKEKKSGEAVARTDKDLPIGIVLIGSLVLILLMAFIPMIPGDSVLSKLFLGVLVVLFGAFFVTVSSRIVVSLVPAIIPSAG